MKLFIINGPNLDMLGIREPRIYGKESYADLENYLRQSAKELGLEHTHFANPHGISTRAPSLMRCTARILRRRMALSLTQGGTPTPAWR